MRVRRMAVAVTVLAVAVSLLVLPAAVARPANNVTLSLSLARATLGGTVTLTATTKPRVKGRSVTFQRLVGSKWTTLTTKRTNAAGLAVAKWKPATTGTFKVRAVAGKKGTASPRTSAVRSLVVVGASTAVNATWPLGPWPDDLSVVVPVAVTPAAAGRVVRLQHLVGSSWVTVGTPGSTNAAGQVTLVWTPEEGTQSLRVSVDATSTHRAATTPVVSRTVTSRDLLEIEAPSFVRTGQEFGVSTVMRALDDDVSNPTVAIEGPLEGHQITPPDDVVLGPTNTGSVTPADVALGTEARVRLGWKAPIAPGPLAFTVHLTAEGIDETRTVVVQVRAAVEGGGGLWGPDLRTSISHQPAPMHKDGIPLIVCQPRINAVVPIFSDALTAAEQFLDDSIIEAHRDAWETLPALDDPDLIDEIVLTAILGKRPAAALAAALRGYELDPGDPAHLTSAAAAANLLGRPEWAVAFATRAGVAGPFVSVGADSEAVRLVNLAHGFALLGRFGDAERVLRRAVLVQPGLPQPQQELRSVLQCSGQKDQALAPARAAVRTDLVEDEVQDLQSYETLRRSWAATSRIFDLSGATAIDPISRPTIPDDFHEFVAMRQIQGGSGYYQTERVQIVAEGNQLRQRTTQLTAQLNAIQATDPYEYRWVRAILDRVGRSSAGEPSVAAEFAAFEESPKQLSPNNCHGLFSNVAFCRPDGGDQGCAAAALVFEELKYRAKFYLAALDDYHGALWEIVSGLMAHVDNPAWRELIANTARQRILTYQQGLLFTLEWSADRFYSAHDEPGTLCGTVTPPETTPVVVPPLTTGKPCSELISALAFAFDTPIGGMSLNCSGFSIEGAASVGWLSAYAQFTLPWANSGVELNVGVKAATPGVWQFESGFYLEMDGNYGVQDAGMKVGPTLQPGAKWFTISNEQMQDVMKLSVMSMFTP